MVTPLGQAAWAQMSAAAEALDLAALEALSPLLILAPHADDETLGCGGLLAAASDLGLRRRVAYLTDGSASHAGAPDWPPTRLAAQRRREALNALAILGVPADDVLFLNWPDAKPYAPGDVAYDLSLQTLTAWTQSFRPRSVWAPMEGEAHCDHQAALGLAHALADRLSQPCVVMEFIVWGWSDIEIAARHGAARIWALDCASHVGRRRRALAQHATQMGQVISGAKASFVIPSELAALTDRPTELFLERRR